MYIVLSTVHSNKQNNVCLSLFGLCGGFYSTCICTPNLSVPNDNATSRNLLFSYFFSYSLWARYCQKSAGATSGSMRHRWLRPLYMNFCLQIVEGPQIPPWKLVRLSSWDTHTGTAVILGHAHRYSWHPGTRTQVQLSSWDTHTGIAVILGHAHRYGLHPGTRTQGWLSSWDTHTGMAVILGHAHRYCCHPGTRTQVWLSSWDT